MSSRAVPRLLRLRRHLGPREVRGPGLHLQGSCPLSCLRGAERRGPRNRGAEESPVPGEPPRGLELRAWGETAIPWGRGRDTNQALPVTLAPCPLGSSENSGSSTEPPDNLLTTHVLDTASGLPARGLCLRLYWLEDHSQQWAELRTSTIINPSTHGKTEAASPGPLGCRPRKAGVGGFWSPSLQPHLLPSYTDPDGRCPGLLTPDQMKAGTYKLTFDTEGYWRKRGQESFYPHVEVRLVLTSKAQKFHMPLVLHHLPRELERRLAAGGCLPFPARWLHPPSPQQTGLCAHQGALAHHFLGKSWPPGESHWAAVTQVSMKLVPAPAKLSIRWDNSGAKTGSTARHCPNPQVSAGHSEKVLPTVVGGETRE
nr:uncharacterized protein LOC129394122 [Pan paniscus]